MLQTLSKPFGALFESVGLSSDVGPLVHVHPLLSNPQRSRVSKRKLEVQVQLRKGNPTNFGRPHSQSSKKPNANSLYDCSAKKAGDTWLQTTIPRAQLKVSNKSSGLADRSRGRFSGGIDTALDLSPPHSQMKFLDLLKNPVCSKNRLNMGFP